MQGGTSVLTKLEKLGYEERNQKQKPESTLADTTFVEPANHRVKRVTLLCFTILESSIKYRIKVFLFLPVLRDQTFPLLLHLRFPRFFRSPDFPLVFELFLNEATTCTVDIVINRDAK